MSSYYPAKRRAPESYTTELDILKASHKFLRNGNEDDATSWEAQLAKKYEDTLFKEFAVCDLKHYKSGNVALRWRTEDEVLSGAGEDTCGNTRCPYHDTPRPTESTSGHPQDTGHNPRKPPKLTTMELPFSYSEQGETEIRQVMVKVVLCERCVKKIMWKREKDKKERLETTGETSPEKLAGKSERELPDTTEESDHRHEHKLHKDSRNERSGRKNDSRSRSPRRRRETKI